MKNYILILILALTLGVNSNIFKSINRSHNMSGKARAAMFGVKEKDSDDDDNNEDSDMYRTSDDNDDDDDDKSGSTDASRDKKSGDSPGEVDND